MLFDTKQMEGVNMGISLDDLEYILDFLDSINVIQSNIDAFLLDPNEFCLKDNGFGFCCMSDQAIEKLEIITKGLKGKIILSSQYNKTVTNENGVLDCLVYIFNFI